MSSQLRRVQRLRLVQVTRESAQIMRWFKQQSAASQSAFLRSIWPIAVEFGYLPPSEIYPRDMPQAEVSAWKARALEQWESAAALPYDCGHDALYKHWCEWLKRN